jgi:hypothetical protein
MHYNLEKDQMGRIELAQRLMKMGHLKMSDLFLGQTAGTLVKAERNVVQLKGANAKIKTIYRIYRPVTVSINK